MQRFIYIDFLEPDVCFEGRSRASIFKIMRNKCKGSGLGIVLPGLDSLPNTVLKINLKHWLSRDIPKLKTAKSFYELPR